MGWTSCPSRPSKAVAQSGLCTNILLKLGEGTLEESSFGVIFEPEALEEEKFLIWVIGGNFSHSSSRHTTIGSV